MARINRSFMDLVVSIEEDNSLLLEPREKEEVRNIEELHSTVYFTSLHSFVDSSFL